MLPGWMERFFASEEEPDATDDAVRAASIALDFSRHAEYAVLVEWLEKEIERPVPVLGDLVGMASAVSRANTLKEVRDHMRRRVRQSEALLASLKERHVGS